MTRGSELSNVTTRELQEALGKVGGVIDSKFQEVDKKFGLIGRLFEDLRNAWKEKDTMDVRDVRDVPSVVAELD